MLSSSVGYASPREFNNLALASGSLLPIIEAIDFFYPHDPLTGGLLTGLTLLGGPPPKTGSSSVTFVFGFDAVFAPSLPE